MSKIYEMRTCQQMNDAISDELFNTNLMMVKGIAVLLRVIFYHNLSIRSG